MLSGDSIAVDKDKEYIELNIAEDGTITMEPDRGVAYVSPDGYVAAKNYTYKFAPFNIEAATVTVPEEADVKTYELKYLPDLDGNEITTTASVAFMDNNVYVKGLTQSIQGWIKGTVDGDSVRFASHQFVGKYNNDEDILKDFAVFFNGAEATDSIGFWGRHYETMSDIAFKFDKETGTLISEKSVTETIGEQNPLSHMVSPKLLPSEAAGDFKPAIPSAPEITNYKDFVFSYRLTVSLPTTDTEGNMLDTDNLYYRFFMNDKPFTFTKSTYQYIDYDEITEIPYSYLDGSGYGSDISKGNGDNERVIVLYDKYNTIGVECVYTIDGVTNVSDRYVYDVKSKSGSIVTGITGNAMQQQIKSVTYTDVNGRKVGNPQKGLYIIVKKKCFAN